NAAYSGANPADGFFKDNSQIGCGFPGTTTTSGLGFTAANTPAGSLADCNLTNGLTPIIPDPTTGIITGFVSNTLFGNAPYPTSGKLFERFGTLGRGVFRGPRFQQLDLALSKTFNLSERMKLRFQANAQ